MPHYIYRSSCFIAKMLQSLLKICDDPALRKFGKVVAAGFGIAIGVVAVYKSYKYCTRHYQSITSHSFCHGSSDPLYLRGEGDRMYQLKKYEEAVKMYTKAIENCPPSDITDLVTLYMKRAGTFDALQKWDEVIKDCDAAIERNNKYEKAYARRASAHLSLSYNMSAPLRLTHQMAALYDAVFTFYLQGGTGKPHFMGIMTCYTKELAELQMEQRQPTPLTDESIREYYSNFPNDPIVTNLMEYMLPPYYGGRSPFQEACVDLYTKDYHQLFYHLSLEIEVVSNKYVKESLLFRATLYIISGSTNQAAIDLDKLISMENVPERILSTALLRRGLLYFEKSQPEKGSGAMVKAIEVDPTNADVYYHQGQRALQIHEYDQCMHYTQKALELQNTEHPSFLIQKYSCSLQISHNQDNKEQYGFVLKQIQEFCDKYPQEPGGWCLYAQAFTVNDEFEKADWICGRAVQNCRSSAKIYIQWASFVLEWTKDENKALELLEKAKTLDPYCEKIYENMGRIYLNQGRLEKSLECFDNRVQYSRDIASRQDGIAMAESVRIQLLFKDTFGVDVPNINTLPSSSS